MKALIVEIGFFEAFFKVHYTKTSRLTYPMPLPTTVAGMFGSMLGFSREKVREAFAECLFGSGILGEVNDVLRQQLAYMQLTEEWVRRLRTS